MPLDKTNLADLPPGLHLDADGLYFQVRGTNSRCWAYRFTFAGKPRHMGLGSWPETSLADARIARNDAYKLKHQGVDPIEQKTVAKAAEKPKKSCPTFGEWFEVWFEVAKPHWGHPKHATQVRSSIEDHALPVFGAVPMTDITRAMVIRALKPIWNKTPETARRTRQRIDAVFTHFLANHEEIEMANPADTKMITKALLEQREEKGQYAALDFADHPAFMAELRKHDCVSALALEFVILTAARTSSALKSRRRREIDLDKRTWTIPKEHMKNGKEHVVPLCDRAIEIVRKLDAIRPEGCDFVFPGRSYNKPLSIGSMLELIDRMGYAGKVTTHGFRATFKTWGEEETGHDSKVIEFALSHQIGDKVERTYNRGALLNKRRVLMDDWATFCAPPQLAVELPDNVVQLKSAAA